MTTPKDGGPAFPQPNHIVEHEGYGRVEARQWMQDSGMSLRDWFAGQALAGWLSSYGDTPSPAHDSRHLKLLAENSYIIADAMLAAREEKNG